MIKNLLRRVVKVEKQTKDGVKFNTYFGIYQNGTGIHNIAVRITKACSAFVEQQRKNTGHRDINIDLKLESDPNGIEGYDAFLAPKRSRVKGTNRYEYVRTKEGKLIPEIVILELTKDNLCGTPLSQFDPKPKFNESELFSDLPF